jgi:hypothetical protein
MDPPDFLATEGRKMVESVVDISALQFLGRGNATPAPQLAQRSVLSLTGTLSQPLGAIRLM